MDLLCTESILTHSEISLIGYNNQTAQNITKHNIKCNSFCEPLSYSSACFSTIKTGNTASSARVNIAANSSVPIACSMSDLMYVLSSVATPANATKLTKQRRSQVLCKVPPHRSCNNTKWACTAVIKKTDAANDHHLIYENMVVSDPIFKTDRCLKNALKTEEKDQYILGTYFKTVQKDITPAMRKIVAQWMMEVSSYYTF
ncbi:uncharacterized protein LOC108658144 [Drosophila navojoa]|uniref:uncharacterized protein LOC108658144 n=1 Tax=Drosophila navojoa TaxID=7232 RepID=UPI000847898A|nr:uncharacterized protein LOC108658144 [Drosophila navojoa]